MTELMKNLGIILIVLGAVLLILTVDVLKDMADYNAYTWGSVGLIVVGLILHIVLNKKYQ